MPPKKKQPPRNGFYYFMLDFKNRQGRNFRGMNEVAEAAGPHWQRMSKEQKKPFEDMASKERNNARAAKYTSEGLDVAELEMEEKQKQINIQLMKDDINYNLQVALQNNRISEEVFCIIHINTFVYCPSIDRDFSAEIGIAAFNLEEGVIEVFHEIIKPGPLPLGYAAEALLISRESHQIPPPSADDTENNLQQVFDKIKNFLSDKLCGSKRFPPLYADEKLIDMIQRVLDNWCTDLEEEKPLFKVYNLQYMFRMLRNTIANEAVWPSDTYSNREIEKDVYAYTKDIACHLHDVSSVPIHCSKSIATRYCYVICDNCCKDLGIRFIPGKHIPRVASVPSSRAGSVASLASSQRSTNLKPTTRDDDDSDSVVSFSSKSSWDNVSVTSEASSNLTLTSDESFPVLGKGRINKTKNIFTPNSWQKYDSPSGGSSQSSIGMNFAGVMGSSGLSKKPAEMPSSVLDDMEKLSVSGSTVSGTRSPNDRGFPALRARGRGRGRGIPSAGRGRKLSNDED